MDFANLTPRKVSIPVELSFGNIFLSNAMSGANVANSEIIPPNALGIFDLWDALNR